MAYLIDGNNFIGYASSYDLKDPRAKYELVSKLLIFQRLKRTKIHLVFDGPLDPRIRSEKLQKNFFFVIFPAPDENADRAIEAVISKQTDLRRFYVVSSDREIRNFAKAKGAKSLKCDEFDKELKAAIRKYKKSLEWQKKDTELSRFEVDQWLKIFKDKK